MISVVIPTLNANKHLPNLLRQLGGHMDDLVVSDGGSVDGSLEAALTAGARLAVGGKGRGWQLARGAKWASADWLLFLHADARLGENWFAAVQDHIRHHNEAAGYFRFKLDDAGWRPRLMERIVALRCHFWQLPYGDQGLLISRALYESVGGYPDWDLFEDVRIAEALRGKLRCLDANLYTDASQYKEQGYWRRARNNFRLYRQYKKGMPSAQLAKEYYK